MLVVRVDLGDRSYNILIKRKILTGAGELIRQVCAGQKVFLLTDDVVNSLYGDRVEEVLGSADFLVHRFVIPHGEGSKSMEYLQKIYLAMAEFGMDRRDVLVTLGGGVVGDLGGLAAATFLRGIDFVQIPTTLLAQVDSSVGGKVAVNLSCGKNLVGAFYQPKLVIVDPDVLRTLSPKILHDGLAEVIKYGCIWDEEILVRLERCTGDEELLAQIEWFICRSCQIKADLVAADERDTGSRMLLNFGHTLGHAIELAGNYQHHTHGEGVALGMLSITRATEGLGLTAAGSWKRLCSILQQYHLLCYLEYPVEQLLPLLVRDKKKFGGEISLVVLEKLGKAVLHPVSMDVLNDYFI